MTIAHELGHGLHGCLSRKQSYFNYDTPLTTAETASVFGEMLAFDYLLVRQTDPQVRIALLAGKLTDIFATVFRQNEAGGSDSPEVLLGRFGVNMHDAAFWWKGFEEIRAFVTNLRQWTAAP